jgi:hypothetical protein
MTHEYVIAFNGHIEALLTGGAAATAVGWAADAVLAVGTDDVVRAISRGDSTFVDVVGCVITPLPADIERAQVLVGKAAAGRGIGQLLVEAGLLGTPVTLEPGATADLAFWRADAVGAHLIAAVRDGAFTEGDEHYGPFPTA